MARRSGLGRGLGSLIPTEVMGDRSSALLEAVNPSEMFGQCMTERSYLECTGSALCALATFRAAYPHVLRAPIDAALTHGVRFLRRRQRPDGSFPGFWGINFTYAIFHVVKGLRAAGVPRGSTTSSPRSMERNQLTLLSKRSAPGD